MLRREYGNVARESIAEICRAVRSDPPLNKMMVGETQYNVKFRFELHVLVCVPHCFQT